MIDTAIPPTPTLFVVGDSTLSAFNDDFFLPRHGYGTCLDRYFNSEIHVRNLALSGRSSKSFLEEPQYQILRKEIRQGDFLIIGFGHNDEKPEKVRYTDPNGRVDDPESFAHHLFEYYIQVARKANAVPLLCTPIVRRSPEGNYAGSFVHITPTVGSFSGGDYPQAIRHLGKMLDVTVLDLTEATRKQYEALGPSRTLSLHARLTEDPASVDNSHLNADGARFVAYLVARELSETGNPLRKFLKNDGTIWDETVFVIQ